MQFEESQTQSLIDSKIMEFAQHARPPMVRTFFASVHASNHAMSATGDVQSGLLSLNSTVTDLGWNADGAAARHGDGTASRSVQRIMLPALAVCQTLFKVMMACL